MRALVLVVFVPVVAFADPSVLDGFRCPDTGRIINLGASRYEVEALCRAPDDRIVTTEERLVQRRARASDFVRQDGRTTTTKTTTTTTPPPGTTSTTGSDGAGIIVAMYRAPGATATTSTSTTTTTTTGGSRARGAVSDTLVAELQEVLVEEWVYDFGRNRFLRFLRFENGRLVAVQDGRKGVKPPQ